MLRLAIVQMSSSSRIDDNLRRMRARLDEAVARGARAVLFPEMAYCVAGPEEALRAVSRFDEVMETFSGWARETGVHLFAGSVREPAGAAGRFHNSLVVFDPTGRLAAKYRKIFLFTASLPDRVYEEAKQVEPGCELATVDVEGVRFGLSICFDVRFPELYRALKKRGAQVLAVPSAFTVPTGKAHWETLLRARAIENQAFVVAPAQTGPIGEGRDAWGHSLVVDPWGEPLGNLGEAPGLWVGDIDPTRIADAEARVAAWACTRHELFPCA